MKAIAICEKLRPIIYNPLMGYHFPFQFDAKENQLTIQNKLENDVEKIPMIYLSIGKVIDNDSDEYKKDPFTIPEVVSRLNKKTSQGKIFVVKVKIEGAEIFVVVKADQISSHNRDLWYLRSPCAHINGELGTHKVISEAYMDGLCSILLSNLAEADINPHFPICYGANVSYTKVKRNTRNKIQGGTLSQVLWIEYLPLSLYHYIKIEKDSKKWWNSIFMIVAALCVAKRKFRFIHNDLHCANIRMRERPKNTVNYYHLVGTKKYFKAETDGQEPVLIDFGRACISPNKDQDLLVSSEFTTTGQCSGYIPDSNTIDLVRFVLSIEDLLPIVEDPQERWELRSLFEKICETKTGLNLFKKIEKKQNLYYYLDELPRKICKNSTPEKVFALLEATGKFTCDKIPEGVKVYEI